MTSAGSINLGVEIDASDFRNELTEAVREAMGPVLQELNRSQQHEYDETARRAERSAARQRAALKSVARQARQTAQEIIAARQAYGDGFPQGGGGGNGGGGNGGGGGNRYDNRSYDNRRYDNRRIDNRRFDNRRDQRRYDQRRYYDNRRYDYSTLHNNSTTYDYRVYNYNGSPGPSPGGGNGGGNSGGGRRGVAGFLTGPVGLNSIALAAQALPAVATGVVNIVGAVQQLGQAGMVLPGIFAAGATSIGTAVIGFKGLGDAVKELNEAAKSGDYTAANDALKDMAPAAADLARELSRLSQGPLKDFQKALAEPMLDGVAEQLGTAAPKILDRAKPGMQKVAGAWNETLKEGLRVASSDSTLNLVDQIFGNTAKGQERANNAIAPLTAAFATLAKEGSYFLPRLGDAITSVSDRFNRFIQTNTKNGNIFRWIDEGLNGMRAFGNAVLNVFKTITGLTKAAGALNGSLSGDGGFLGWLERSTKAMSDLTNSDSGQARLTKFFRDGREDLNRWGQLLKEIWPALREIIKGFQAWGEIIFPIIKAIGSLMGTLGEVPGLLQAVVIGFLAWRTVGGIIGGITTKLKGMNAAAAAGGGFGRTQSALLGGTMLLGGSMMQQNAGTSTTSGVLGALTTIGGGALLGGTIGSVIPGVGTGIGAVVGGAAGAALAGYNALVNQNKVATEAAAAASEKWAATNERSHQAVLLTSQAVKTMNDALAESGGKVDESTLAAVGDQVNAIPERLAGAYDESTLKGIGAALGNVNMTTTQMAATITGAQPQFDALTTRLNSMGPAGQIAATQLAAIRDNTLGAAQNAGTAAPLLQQLADSFGGIAGAQVAVQNAFEALPTDVPINVSMAGVTGPGGVEDILTQIGVQIDHNKNGEIIVPPIPDTVLRQLEALGVQIERNRDGTINVQLDQARYQDTITKLGTVGQLYDDLFRKAGALPMPPVPGPQRNNAADPFQIPHGADGMVIPGYAPGRDIVNAVLAPGEGVLIPEAVRGIGGPAGVYALNSQFRNGLSRRYYADGGVHGGTGALPGPAGGDTELGVLIQIRDLLAGKGGVGAVAQTAAATDTIAKASAGTTGQTTGPFGTPIKARNRGYEAAAAAIQALGGDPEKWIGADPTTYVPPTASSTMGGTLSGTTAMPGMVDIAALQKFAMTGNTADLPPGMSLNDPVVTAITGARNKKKGLGDQAISDLIGQGLAPGGFTGTLDSANTPLVKALERLRTKGVKTAGLGGLPVGTAAPTSAAGLKPGAASLKAMLEQQFPGINIGGFRANDPFPDHPSGNALDIMTGGDSALGDQINQYLQDNAASLGLQYTLWQQQNWKPGVGPSMMGDRGSPTQNHMDHVHAMLGGTPDGSAVPGMGGGLLATNGAGGTPVFVTNWPGQGGGIGGNILGAGLSAAGGAAAGVSGDVLSGIAGGLGPTGPRKPSAELLQLVKERNPMALMAAMGFDVQDFTKAGNPNDFAKPDEAFDASGRLFSDTGALADRTTTSLAAQLDAMRQQLTDAVDQVADKLTEDALKPIVESAIQSGLEGLKDSVSQQIGTALGNAAAPPIADAVRSAIPSQPANPGSGAVEAVAGAAFADGGPVAGRYTGVDTVPAMLMPGEHVFTRADVARMGGQRGVYAFRRALARGGVRGFATGGGVNANDVVGAEFFGVSEIPILSTIVNLLVRVLLKVLGVEIEARDTLNEMTGEFRQFRGDFKAFDATGRLMNDTSALVERSSTSELEAAQERIRILKIVIEALIKYIIEKVIVPITKAVANAAIQAGASAAGAAVNTQAPGAGGIVSSLISSAGSAGVDIAAQIGTDLALAITSVAVEAIGEAIMSYFPDLATAIFGGGIIEQFLVGPLTSFITDPILGAIGGIFALFAGVFGGAASMVPGLPFDNGGLATGMGMMPKATIAPERVLSPQQTVMWDRMIAALERGATPGSGRTIEVHAPITVQGGMDAGKSVQESILDMVNG